MNVVDTLRLELFSVPDGCAAGLHVYSGKPKLLFKVGYVVAHESVADTLVPVGFFVSIKPKVWVDGQQFDTACSLTSISFSWDSMITLFLKSVYYIEQLPCTL